MSRLSELTRELDFSMTYADFKEKLRSGEIQIEDNRMFARYDNKVEAFIESLRQSYLTDNMLVGYNVQGLESTDYTLLDGTINFPICVHSFIIDREVGIELRNNIIRFCIRERNGENVIKNYNFIPEDITEPIRYSLDVESQRLVFCNFFRREHLPENERWTEKYSINGVLGIRNVAEYMATQGFGYGQTGNTSMCLYSNGKEIIIVRSNNSREGIKELIEELVEYEEEENFDNEQLEEYREQLRELQPLFQYLDDNNFEEKGYISCGMWRWECADFNKARYLQKSGDVLDILIEGNKVNVEVYEHSLGVSPISEYISSHFKVVS